MLSSGDNSLECLNIPAMIHSPCSCSMHVLVDAPFPVYVPGHIYSVVGRNLRLTARNLIQIRCSTPVSMDIVGRLCRFYGAGQVLRQQWRARRYKLAGWGNQSSRDLASPGRLSAAYSSGLLASDKPSPPGQKLSNTCEQVVFAPRCLPPASWTAACLSAPSQHGWGPGQEMNLVDAQEISVRGFVENLLCNI